ncbi:metal ABC transporter ATP-binding protein [Psychromonas arctica]|uniref:Metal ABC transporter ATP-binding protein n=1 Tax=Psychromonas arctica TaxID=168275 RepID=A0ABU9HC64_9GAMM
MINILNLCVNYKDSPALNNISVEIKKGQLIAIVGANGAGKSTLLKAIMGQLEPSSGFIELGVLTSKDIAYLPQSHKIDRKFPITVKDFISAGSWKRIGFWKKFSSSENELLQQALNKVSLEGFEERQISTLSGGQFQRMLFARMLMQDADILLLDEPFTAIDTQTTMDLMNVINDCQQQGKTIITVIHDLLLVSRFFPNVILLAKELIAYGSVKTVMTSDNLSKAGYQHLAYISHTMDISTPLTADSHNEVSSSLPKKNSTHIHCTNPAHYEEKIS